MAVQSLEITKRSPYRDGAQFGDVGTYERIEGVLHYAVDPQAPDNARIVDLGLAPRDGDGRVCFQGSVSMLLPTEPTRANATLLLDVPNRGARLSLTSFNLVRRDLALTDPLNPGDGFLFRRGFALATVGWQWDVDPSLGAWLRAPRALEAGGELRGEVICHLRPDSDTDTMHIGQLGAAPYAPADLLDPAARLYVTNEMTRHNALVPRAPMVFRTAQRRRGRRQRQSRSSPAGIQSRSALPAGVRRRRRTGRGVRSARDPRCRAVVAAQPSGCVSQRAGSRCLADRTVPAAVSV